MSFASLACDPQPDGEGERILPGTIVERLTLSSSGALVPLTEGCTKAVAEIRTHAGICKIERWKFALI